MTEKEKNMKKNRIVLPPDMDKECIAICEALNELPHTETEESCCGHLKSPFRVWFRCSSFTYLAIIARAIDRRYAGTQKEWRLVSESGDMHPRFFFMLTSVERYQSTLDMKKDTDRIIANIRYWRENYLEYFRSDGEVTNPGKAITLTSYDIALIDELLREVSNSIAVGDLPEMNRQAFYREVLNRYNNIKNED